MPILRVYRRTAASAVETAFVLPVALLALFAILDLGLATIRYNSLAEAARRLARAAIMRGSETTPEVTKWGPEPVNGNAGDGSEPALTIGNLLPTMDLNAVAIHVTWPDVSNAPGSRVRVELEYQHQSLLHGLAPWSLIDLESASQMRIVN